MKDLERYLGAIYINRFQTYIMNVALANLPDPEIPTTTSDTGVKRLKTDADITYLKNKNIYEAIYQKLRNKEVYKTDMHNICGSEKWETTVKLA